MNALHPEVLVLPEEGSPAAGDHLGEVVCSLPLTGPTGGRIQRSLGSLYHHDP